MASNPLVQQGTLNRLRGSVVIPGFPQLNVTAPFLGKEMINMALEGDVTKYIDTATGAVTSPEPYMRGSVEVHLLKTQNLSSQYKAQLELSSLIGGFTVYGDTVVHPPYNFFNGSIMGVRVAPFAGEDPGYLVTLGGLYYINSALFGAS